MPKLNTEDIQKLGELSRIGISKEQAGKLAPQLGQILEYVAHLGEIDTADTEITSQVTGLEDVWREDEIKPSELPREELLKNAPATQDGYIKVRRVI